MRRIILCLTLAVATGCPTAIGEFTVDGQTLEVVSCASGDQYDLGAGVGLFLEEGSGLSEDGFAVENSGGEAVVHYIYYIEGNYGIVSYWDSRPQGTCGTADFSMSDYTRADNRVAVGSVDLDCVLDDGTALSGSVEFKHCY